jgi:hypothetical protein
MNIWFLTTMIAAFILSAVGAIIGVRTLRAMQARKGIVNHGDESLTIPMAALQQRALWNIFSMFVGMGIMVWLFSGHEVTDFFEDDRFRIWLTSVIVLTLLINLLLMLPTSRRGRWSKLFDERDELVLSRASAFQLTGLLCLSVIWTIGLTEHYWNAGSIPIDIPYLMFWSNFLMLFLSRSIGIVYGYWWLDRYGN